MGIFDHNVVVYDSPNIKKKMAKKKRGPGRPKGSKNKPGSKKPGPKRGPGRPKGSGKKRGRGRPRGSTNKSVTLSGKHNGQRVVIVGTIKRANNG